MTYRLLATCTLAAVIASPAVAAAQPEVFAHAFFELTAAVEGTYGDEGAHIAPALEKMAGALVEWDRSIQVFEARVGAEARGAPPRVAVEMHVTLARMYAQRGRLADALRELDSASRLEPQGADVQVLRGLVLETSDRPVEAAGAFRTAWTLAPRDPMKAYYAIRHAGASGSTRDTQAAHEALRAAHARLLTEGVRPKAPPFIGGDLLRDGANESPVLPLAAYARGYARIAQRDYDEAIAEFRKAAATDPLVVDPAARSAAVQQAVGALKEGRLADARTLLERADALHDSSEAHRVLALIYWAESQYDKSVEQLTLAIRQNPADERSRLALSRVLSSAGRDADADRVLRDTIKVLPDSVLAHWWLALGLERVNRFADARREFEYAAAGAVAGRSQLYAATGRLASRAGDLTAAVEAFDRAINASPNDPTLHKSLAVTLQQQDEVDEAFAEFVAALLIDPLDAGAHAGIGAIHLNAGRIHEAVNALRRAVDLSPNHTETRYALATALMRSGNTTEAEQELDRVEQAQRRQLADRRRKLSRDVLQEEAALRAAEGSFVAAIDLYEKAIALGADPVVYRQLADLYSRVGRNQDAARARAMYERDRGSAR